MAGFWRNVRGLLVGQREDELDSRRRQLARRTAVEVVEVGDDDPVAALLQRSPGALRIDQLDVESPLAARLRDNDMRLAIPLVAQGELVGMLNLGPRLSGRHYSSKDRKLLCDLAGQAAPALRVAQLVRQQEQENLQRERMTHELRIAHRIQQSFLPRELPRLQGWNIAAHYQPASAVGGDFYDFIPLPEGRYGLVVGDVTDKGVPAALVMASTRSMLRGAAQSSLSPGEVLASVNDRLHDDIPATMFATCLYMILDPATGWLRYANAGHNLPLVHSAAGARELRATGMPLGLLPEVRYDEFEARMLPGESLLLYSDGLTEAHDRQRRMFGSPRLVDAAAGRPGGAELISELLDDLANFTGPDWEQEDDITLVTLRCDALPLAVDPAGAPSAAAVSGPAAV